MSALDLIAARARRTAARARLDADIAAFRERAAPRAVGTRLASRISLQARDHRQALAGLGTGASVAVLVPAAVRLLAAGLRRLRRPKPPEPMDNDWVKATETASAMEGRGI